MSLLPEGEALRNAIKWISEECKRQPDQKMSARINAACTRFDLQPNEGEFLLRFYQKEDNCQTE